MLAQHAYLTTDQLRRLFWPDNSLRIAQQRLHWLLESRLVTRWHQMGPQVGRWRRYSSVLLLTQLGAVEVAIWLGRTSAERNQLVQRSYYAFAGSRAVIHDLEVTEFFVALAASAARLPGQGLYHWVGEASMRGQYQRAHGQLRHAGDLAPDGWGRFVIDGADVRFNLEWDRGTEPPDRLGRKAEGYLRYAPPGEHVLMVLPNSARERSVREHVAAAGAGDPARGGRRVLCWTTTVQLVEDRGPLNDIWLGFGGEGERRRLGAMAARASDALPVEASIGKPGWWMQRPGAGEGTHRPPPGQTKSALRRDTGEGGS